MELGNDRQISQPLSSPYPRNDNRLDAIDHAHTTNVNIAQTPQWGTFPQLPTPVTFEDGKVVGNLFFRLTNAYSAAT